MPNGHRVVSGQFVFHQRDQSGVLGPKSLRHLFGCELLVGHLVIDRAQDVIVKADLENLSSYIAARDFSLSIACWPPSAAMFLLTMSSAEGKAGRGLGLA